MNQYFEIKPGCKLYKSYFKYKAAWPKIMKAFENMRKKFGIETKSFYVKKDKFWIVPTESDWKKFSGMMKKTNYGEFKKNSEPSKAWRELVKDIRDLEKPKLVFYFRISGIRWKERLFHIGEKLYCSIESENVVSTPDFAIEMKASEFFKIVEDHEENK